MARHDREACPGCHIHPAVIDDLGPLTFEDRLCKVCRGQAGYGRALGERDRQWDEAHPKAQPTEPRPADGRYTSMRPLTPDELAEREARRKRR
ncbi:MAG TPA: hypothetical protein VFJ19_18440 [Nocardioidaceae bacterium]|nr:hypothetical protein [Nocardioidaceae bacterium]